MKHRIDMEEPETGKIKIGRANNPKRAQQEANRQGEIDLENQVLLDKLVRIKQFDSSKIFKPWLGRSTFQYKCVARAVNRGAGVGGVQYGIAVVGRLPACPTPLSLQYTLALPPEFYMACTESRLAVPPPPPPLSGTGFTTTWPAASAVWTTTTPPPTPRPEVPPTTTCAQPAPLRSGPSRPTSPCSRR